MSSPGRAPSGVPGKNIRCMFSLSTQTGMYKKGATVVKPYGTPVEALLFAFTTENCTTWEPLTWGLRFDAAESTGPYRCVFFALGITLPLSAALMHGSGLFLLFVHLCCGNGGMPLLGIQQLLNICPQSVLWLMVNDAHITLLSVPPLSCSSFCYCCTWVAGYDIYNWQFSVAASRLHTLVETVAVVSTHVQKCNVEDLHVWQKRASTCLRQSVSQLEGLSVFGDVCEVDIIASS